MFQKAGVAVATGVPGHGAAMAVFHWPWTIINQSLSPATAERRELIFTKSFLSYNSLTSEPPAERDCRTFPGQAIS